MFNYDSPVAPNVEPNENCHYSLCDLVFTDLDPQDAPTRVLQWATEMRRHGISKHIHLVNAYTVALCEQDTKLHDTLHQPNSINLVDGTPLIWAARRRSLVPKERQAVRGPSLFWDTLKHASGDTSRHYLLGGTPEALGALVDRVSQELPGVCLAGATSPPFRALSPVERMAQDREISQTDPDIIWVGLGTPKQDFEAARLAEQHKCLAIAVGAAFDFASGSKREAPTILHNSGCEWVYRLATEPARLTRRYTFGSLAFLRALKRASKKVDTH
jgi:N-acetylglucosaminyldiphosphoundecaprenol N-acetyl-beta-D-mannosaminyltransferase